MVHRRVNKVPRKAGVYTAARAIQAWKGLVHNGAPLAIQVTIPKGATIVVPEVLRNPRKFRTGAISIPGSRIYTSPYQGMIYLGGETYICEVSKSIYEACDYPGFYVTWSRYAALKYAKRVW